MLRPPSGLRTRIPRSTSGRMSRKAVSCEHLASCAYFDVVSFPSKPSRSRFNTRRWRELRGTQWACSQDPSPHDMRRIGRVITARRGLRSFVRGFAGRHAGESDGLNSSGAGARSGAPDGLRDAVQRWRSGDVQWQARVRRDCKRARPRDEPRTYLQSNCVHQNPAIRFSLCCESGLPD